MFADRYVIRRLVSRGGMAEVYVARHRAVGRVVAIKVLLPHMALDAEAVGRFQAEARAAGTLGHPNIAECLDMGTAPDGSPFLVMEYVEGTSLREEVAKGPMHVERGCGIAMQIASALEMAHVNEIVHRDLKPENVLLVERPDQPDVVKLVDFGIAKVGFSSSGAPAVTRAGFMLGTPDYMSPEQIRDPGNVDHRSDVWALGVVLYEMIAGKHPFGDEPFPAILNSIETRKVPALTEVRSGVPEQLAALVARMLEKPAAARPSSMGEVFASLEPLAGAQAPRRITAHRRKLDLASLPPPADLVQDHPTGAPSVRPAARDEKKPVSRIFALGAAVVLLSFGGLLVARLAKSRAESEQRQSLTAVEPSAPAPPTTPSAVPRESGAPLDGKQVAAVVKAHREEVQTCLDSANETREVQGQIEVKGRVNEKGRIIELDFTSTVGDPKFEDCVVTAFKKWDFPEPKTASTAALTFTFKFK